MKKDHLLSFVHLSGRERCLYYNFCVKPSQAKACHTGIDNPALANPHFLFVFVDTLSRAVCSCIAPNEIVPHNP